MIETKSITIDDIVLSYVEKNAKASSSIFFFHGNSNSSRIWKKQYCDELFSKYRLVVFDLPAHGKSSSSPAPFETYNVIAMGEIMAKAVKQLSDFRPYIFAGFSLGTNIIAESLAFGAQPEGLVMAGSSLVGGGITPGDVVMPGVAGSVLFEDNVQELLTIEYVSACCISADNQDRVDLINDYYAVKPSFRPSLKEGILKGKYSDEIKLVQKSGLPVLAIYGIKEEITPPNLLDNLQINFWKNRAFKLDEASHTVMLDQPLEFNNLLESFAREIL